MSVREPAAGQQVPRFHPAWLGETALLVGVAAVQAVGSTGASRGQPGRLGLDALGYALLLAGPALLALRRWRPVPVLAAVLVLTVAYYVVGYPYGPAFLSLVVALFTAVLTGHRAAAWVLGGLGLTGYFVVDTMLGGRGPAFSLASVAGHVAWLLVVLIVAEVVRIQRTRAGEVRRIRAETERRRASEERLRIARELHDVLGHSISLINVQAGVALHLMDQQPEQARSALRAIKEVSKGTLQEVRATLDVLRGDEAPPRQPAPGLDRLPDLVSQFAMAGLEVTVTSRGQRPEVASSVDLAAYRIVQEALTNVLRHAASPTAEVVLDHVPGSLTVTITDAGEGLRSGQRGDLPAGRGIAGMRERAASVAGSLSAGPDPGGGFRVSAHLPLDPAVDQAADRAQDEVADRTVDEAADRTSPRPRQAAPRRTP
ncbi:MAG: sensor histidine kinase [Streptomycetales bacterium]